MLRHVHCAHEAHCPGCPLLARPYAEQLDHKRTALVAALGAYPVLGATPVEPTVGAEPSLGFRLRTKVVVSGTALGLFARGTHDVVDVPECLVLRPRLHAAARALRGALPLPVSSFDLREADDGVLVTAAVPPALAPDARRALAERIATLDANIASVAVSTREDDAPQVLGGALEVLVGPTELRHRPDPTAPWHYAAHGAFTQAHAGQIAKLHAAIEAELRRTCAPHAVHAADTPPHAVHPADTPPHAVHPADTPSHAVHAADTPPHAVHPDTPSHAVHRLAGLRVLELYAGSGALALRLAERGADVTLVESFAPAVRLAERAAAEQRLTLHAITADAGAALAGLGELHRPFDAVIVDPPRRGLTPEVRRRIAALAPKLLLYVSCAPETLARDAAHFAHLAFALEEATPFDMIPLTDAVETLARFVPRAPPRPVVLASTEHFVAVDQPPHTGGPSAVSGVTLLPRRPADTHAIEQLLAQRQAEYVILARGVLRAGGTLSLKTRDARARYERLEVLGGHSLLRVTAPAGGLSALFRTLAALGHPVLGDARHGDRRANAHFSHRHELERSFCHRSALTVLIEGEPRRLESPLAPDLARVLASLRALPNHASPRAGSRRRARRD